MVWTPYRFSKIGAISVQSFRIRNSFEMITTSGEFLLSYPDEFWCVSTIYRSHDSIVVEVVRNLSESIP